MAKSFSARLFGVAFGVVLLATVASVAMFAGGEVPPPDPPSMRELPPTASPTPLSFPTDAADAVVFESVESHAIAGAVTTVVDRKGRFATACVGSADLATDRPMEPDTLFWIASMTKPITATGVMMLVDEGKLALNDSVATYLPEFAGQQVGVQFEEVGDYADAVALESRPPTRPVAVRDLLRHVAGLPGNYVGDGRQLDARTLAEKTKLFAQMPLLDDPGATHLYSNVGYEILGRLIEVVSGMPYEMFLAQRLFEPLGMVDTTFRPSPEQLERLATTYFLAPGASELEERRIRYLTYPFDDPARQPAASLGLFSTAADCARFCRMHLAGGELDGVRYLSAENCLQMQRAGRHPAAAAKQGFGWVLGKKIAGHGGVNGTSMYFDRARGTAAVFLVASQDGSYGPAAEVFLDYRDALSAAADGR